MKYYLLNRESLQIEVRDIAEGESVHFTEHASTVHLEYEIAHRRRMQIVEDRIAKFSQLAQVILLNFETLAAELRDVGVGVKA